MLNEGTYRAVAEWCELNEAKSGALMVRFGFVLTEQGLENQKITGSQCLIQKDGTVSEITAKTLKQCFGVENNDQLLALEDPANLAGKEVEIVVVHETYEGKLRASVRFINPIGGGRGTPIDRDKFIQKHGTRLRAVFASLGGTTTKPAPKAATPPARSTPPPRQSAPPQSSKPKRQSTMEECWHALHTANPGMSDDALGEEWHAMIDRLFPGRNNSDLTGSEWGEMIEEIEGDTIPA